MTPRSRLRLVLFVLPLAAGCGAKTTLSDLDDAVSASGGAAKGGAPSAVPSCDSFDDEGPALLHIQLVNQASEQIYVGEETSDCSSTSFFAVNDANGSALPKSSACRTSHCRSVPSDVADCADFCLSPTALVLLPGQTAELTWDGLYLSREEPPGACLSAPKREGTCDRARRVRPGTFTFTAKAGNGVDCSRHSSMGVCRASPTDGSNLNMIEDALIVGKIRSASLQLRLDPGYGVLADGPMPSGSGPRAVLPVELVFRD